MGTALDDVMHWGQGDSMTAQLLGSFTVESEEWYAARRTRVGGSEAAAILGLSPYESRFSLYHRKQGAVEQQVENKEMNWGKRLESAVAGKWLENHGDTHTVRAENGTYLSATHPFMVANPDVLVFNLETNAYEVVEIKTSPMGDGWGPSGTDIYPVYYLTQCLHYGHTLEVEAVHLAVLISGCDYREYTITMADHAADVALIIEAEQQFIHDLQNDVRPDIDGHSQTYEVVKQLHPEIEAGDERELKPATAVAYLSAKAQYDQAATEHNQARSAVCDEMGNANYATHNGNRIARRQAKGDAAPFLVAVKQPPTKKKVQAA